GNTSTTNALSMVLDTVTPTAETPALDAASDTGVSDSDSLTNATAPVFKVTLDPNVSAGDTIELKSGGASLAHPAIHVVTAAEVTAGVASVTVTSGDLGADGVKTLTATISDTAGNTSDT